MRYGRNRKGTPAKRFSPAYIGAPKTWTTRYGRGLESDKRFKSGEQVKIHVYRMGWMRARITSCRSKVVAAEFIQECPVQKIAFRAIPGVSIS